MHVGSTGQGNTRRDGGHTSAEIESTARREGKRESMTHDKLHLTIPWDDIDHGAQEQIQTVLAFEFVNKLAIMPDVHQGYDMPIGGVCETDGVISPAWVGYDIGCGMRFVRTDEQADAFDEDDLKQIRKRITESVPMGVGAYHQEKQDLPLDQFETGNKDLDTQSNARAPYQVGTLGAGNHFIELGVDNSSILCVTIHSGSRGIGHKVAGYFMKMAKTEDNSLPPGFFNVDGDWGCRYVAAMYLADEFARLSRELMMRRVLTAIGTKERSKPIDISHNHALKPMNGTVLHRKGAISADLEEQSVIPGSMGTGVYVVEGLGHPETLHSASHGAGRRFSRKEARESISMEAFEKSMSGIIGSVDKTHLDEAPAAYKDIEHVITAQQNINIVVLDHIKPNLNIKG